MNSVAVVGNHIATISIVFSTLLFLSSGLNLSEGMTRNKRVGKGPMTLYLHSHKGIGGFNLAIDHRGVVKGVRQKTPHAVMILRVENTVRDGVMQKYVTIQGRATKRYVCMDRRGLLYSNLNCTDECMFNEGEHSPFASFYSSKYPTPEMRKHRDRRWYIALDRRSGRPVPGFKAKKYQKRIHFVRNPINGSFNNGGSFIIDFTDNNTTQIARTTEVTSTTTAVPKTTDIVTYTDDSRGSFTSINSNVSKNNTMSQVVYTGDRSGKSKHRGRKGKGHRGGRKRQKKHKRRRNRHRDLYKIIMDSVLT
ncbi:fibroblast growth factor 9-like [Tubulanus polymorphus]|uniref:fibroblast growth factor 9-like n=1 Tax=Tubulanus polymorphus TaxID=672921 RepID=UPI003DA54C7F